MSWENEVKELERRRFLAQQQGGKEGIARQHAKGRLTIRERIDALLEEKRALADVVVGSGEGWVTELDDDALRALVSLGRGAVLEDE